MARPAKSTSTKTGTITKEEEYARRATENLIKGDDDKLTPPDHLTPSQRDIFMYIITELKAAGILGNLDIFVLTNAAITIDRMIEIESQINDNPSLMFESKVMASRDKYSKDFFRCCNELSLSPQARAKLSISNFASMKENENPLLKVLDL